MTGMTLYDISTQYQHIFNNILEDDDDVNNEEILSIIADNIQDKAIAIASFIKNLEVQRNAIEDARKMMQEREKRLDKKIEWMKNYLLVNLLKCDIKEITKSPYFLIKVRKCPPSVAILDENLIPNDYKITKEIVTFDKNKMKADMLEGVYIEGADLSFNQRIDIK